MGTELFWVHQQKTESFRSEVELSFNDSHECIAKLFSFSITLNFFRITQPTK